MKSKVLTLMFLVISASLLAGENANPAAVALTSEPSHHLVLENSKVRVLKVEVPPHSATLLHRHDRDYLFVSLGESQLTNEIVGKPPAPLQLKDGEVLFAKGGFAH